MEAEKSEILNPCSTVAKFGFLSTGDYQVPTYMCTGTSVGSSKAGRYPRSCLGISNHRIWLLIIVDDCETPDH